MNVVYLLLNIDPQDYVLRMAETKAAEGAKKEGNALVKKPKDKEDIQKYIEETEIRRQ